MTMADQLAVLNDGELQQIGSPLECYHEPANRFVAGFIGSPQMNFFDFEARDGAFVRDEFTYQLPPGLGTDLALDGSSVTLGIRPEDIVIDETPTENSIAVTANVIEQMGDLTHVYVDVFDQQCIVTVSGDETVEPGEQFHIEFPPSRIHVFDSETGDAIKNRDREAEPSQAAHS